MSKYLLFIIIIILRLCIGWLCVYRALCWRVNVLPRGDRPGSWLRLYSLPWFRLIRTASRWFVINRIISMIA